MSKTRSFHLKQLSKLYLLHHDLVKAFIWFEEFP